MSKDRETTVRHSFSLSNPVQNLVPSPKTDWENGCTIGINFGVKKGDYG